MNHHRARKRFGQHFLTDRTVAARIIDAFAPARGQHVIEIGGGRGALTDALYDAIGQLTVIELDRDLAAQLTAQHATNNVRVICADVLEVQLRELAMDAGDGNVGDVDNVVDDNVNKSDGVGNIDSVIDDNVNKSDGVGNIDSVIDDSVNVNQSNNTSNTDAIDKSNNVDNIDSVAADNTPAQFRIIGNLPYNISTPLIFHLLEQLAYIADMLFMVQREVAMRLAATPGERHYGRLSVMCALHLDCARLFDVEPTAFAPPPKVQSSVVRMHRKSRAPMPRDVGAFSAIVQAAFNQRRKTLRNALKGKVSPAQFAAAQIDSTLRAEVLSVQQFIALADAVGE